nr:EamA family transporter [Actinopolyspora righensis]
MTRIAEAGSSAADGSPARTWSLTGLAALAPATWGTTYLVTTEFLPPDRPILSGAIRALPAGLIVLALTRTLPRGSWWWRAALLGTLNIGAFFALLFVAAYRLPGGVAATLSAVQPLLVAGLAFGLLGERPTRWRLGWGVAGVVGVAMMVLQGKLSFDPIGILAGLAGAGAMSAGVVLTKRWGRPEGVSLLTFTGWQLTAGGLLLAPLALAFEGMPPPLDLSAMAGYLWLGGVGTLLAYMLWFQGVARLPVAAVSFLGLLSPAVATILGWLVLNETLTGVQTIGFVLALLSIAAAQLSPPDFGRSHRSNSPSPSGNRHRKPLRRRSPTSPDAHRQPQTTGSDSHR